MIDFSGKLNRHEDYVDILNFLDKKCHYIEVVLIDEKETNDLIEIFKENIVSVQLVSEWWATKTINKNKLIRIDKTKELFDYLKNFETFCKYYVSCDKGDYSEITDFGLDDIAFYDKNNNILLCTITHEGNIYVCDDFK